ncbi:MAG: alpha/beta fold hydrolase [Selenomonadaceae bacterium]|nr:alpha/beta fold hydrolase [Selenomonadaceae bacterium]
MDTTIQSGVATGSGELVVFSGKTTVESFKSGFGEGSDTVYIPEDYPAVDFKEGVLTFYDDTNSLTFKNITSTAQINTYYAMNGSLDKQVYIADDEWYKVTKGEAQYYVGATAKMNHGIDFSGITRPINVTLDTADVANDESIWINNVYSIRGGNSSTTITGSAKADTILAGTGSTTINAAGGNDLISLSSDSALITYETGDGNDTIYGFDSNSTLSSDSTYTTQVSGNDLIVTIGNSKITLVDAASLSNPNIASSNPLVQVVEAILKRTEAGYPVIAGLVFNPTEITGPTPTNYAAKEDWTIKSADNLELYGVHYTPENSNDKWVVLVHGYGCDLASMNPFATFYLANDYNVLMIDQRAAGKSEGTWLTMGVAESQDVALWTQEIVNRYPDSKITLHGVSMGAATAMLAAARSDIKNVTSIVEDCGYSDVMKTFDTIVSSHPELAALGISSEIIPLIDPVAQSLTGYYLHDAAPIDSIASVKMPTLFISGDDDGVAPVSMLHELYDESGAEVKEKFIVEGAGHARSGLDDPVGYSNAVFRFVAEADGEGWSTDNFSPNISLRGTKYNDTISNSGYNVTVNALGGNDSITNIGASSTIYGGTGDDSISNSEVNEVLINAGSGNDFIYNYHAYYPTLKGGAGNDSIVVTRGHYTNIDGGAGNDTILGEITDANSTWAMGGYAVISGGSGNDFINPIFSDSASILGGRGNDTIINQGDDTTLNGGTGDDVISLQGSSIASNVFEYATGDGSDKIFGFNETATLSLTSGASWSTVQSGSDVVVQVADSSITLANAASLNTLNIINYEIPALNINNTSNDTLITGSAKNDTIQNSGSNVTIRGKAGNDSIVSSGSRGTLNGEAGNDTLKVSGSQNVVNGDYGNDSIQLTAGSYQLTVNGGYGNDTIEVNGSNVTVNPGAGYDSVSIGGENVLLYYDGGIDTVIGFNNTSAVSVNSSDYETFDEGISFMLYKGKNDFLYLENVGLMNDEIKINGEAHTLENKKLELLSPGTYTIGRSNVSIVGTEGDDVISLASTATNDVIEYTGGNDTIYGYNETTTLSISGNYSSVVSGKDVIFTTGGGSVRLVDAGKIVGSGNSFVLYEKSTVTVDGRTFELTEDVPQGLTVTGANGSYTLSHVITDTEAAIGDFSSDDVRKLFTEKVLVAGSDNYSLQASTMGLVKVSGISGGATVTGGLTSISGSAVPADDEYAGQYFYVDTATEGSITFDKRTYNISGDESVELEADFDSNGGYVGAVDSLNGTISGDFTAHEVTINSSNALQISGDESVGISDDGYKIIDLAENASLTVSRGGTYTVNDTELKAKSGDVIIGLSGSDAYIYGRENLITRSTSTEDIISFFNPKNTSVISSQADVTLGGGDLAIVENTSERVNITSGDDTIVSKGSDVHATLTGGNTWLFVPEGKMTLEGYDASTGSGFGTNYSDIYNAIDSEAINFSRGGKVSINSAEIVHDGGLVNFFDRVGHKQKVGFAQGESLDASLETDNLLLVAKRNGSITGGSGNDTIIANAGAFVDGGAGSNFVTMSGGNSNIVFNGKTTVEGFNTGFGSGSDTLYIPGDPAGVDFKADGLTFIGGNNSVLLSNVTDTAKVNLFHRKRNVLNKGVFIAQDKWYKVESSDLTVKSGEEVYFVGPSPTGNYGVDFSGISQALNITLDTAYVDSPDYVPTTMWVNSVHSIKGGAGKTTITSSAKNDTMVSGSGYTEFKFAAGSGIDTIKDFAFLDEATPDKIDIGSNDVSKVTVNKEGTVALNFNSGNDWLMIEGAQGKTFKLNDLAARVDLQTIAYDKQANYFMATAKRATLTVDEGAEIWLDGSQGKTFVGDIRCVDATNSTGRNVLAGNELNNTLKGGYGDATLWGGDYGDDLMIGGSSRNTFVYALGNGNDRIQNANSGDVVRFDGLTLDDISSARTVGNYTAINFTDGGSLQVTGSADVAFSIGGEKYTAAQLRN